MQTHPIIHVHASLPVETCAQCGHPISTKETPHLWRGTTVVCSICHEMLQDQQMIYRAFGKAVPGLGGSGFKGG